jgi:hypothetical protein
LYRYTENIREMQFDMAVEKTMSLRQHFMEQATRHSSSFHDDEDDEDEVGLYKLNPVDP